MSVRSRVSESAWVREGSKLSIHASTAQLTCNQQMFQSYSDLNTEHCDTPCTPHALLTWYASSTSAFSWLRLFTALSSIEYSPCIRSHAASRSWALGCPPPPMQPPGHDMTSMKSNSRSSPWDGNRGKTLSHELMEWVVP